MQSTSPLPLDELVKAQPRVPGGPWFVELAHANGDSVRLGPYSNPSMAQIEAKRVRDWLQHVLDGRTVAATASS